MNMCGPNTTISRIKDSLPPSFVIAIAGIQHMYPIDSGTQYITKPSNISATAPVGSFCVPVDQGRESNYHCQKVRISFYDIHLIFWENCVHVSVVLLVLDMGRFATRCRICTDFY